ncbi:MazG-like family protein [Chloroflexi bacterium TSY]|nr:MazG-like family protein [Chloroflexi bacterium TSY]
MTTVEKLYKIVEGLNTRFPDGRDPFQMVTRLAEECGEVAAEVNHFERTGRKVEAYGEPNKQKLAKELQDVMRAVLSLAQYYRVETELEASIDFSYQRMIDEGLIEPSN